MKSINKLTILFIVIYLCVFVGAICNALTFVGIAIAFIVSLMIAYESTKSKNTSLCSSIILLLCLQNFLIGAGAHLFGNTDESLKLLTQIPFMVIFVNWLFIQINKKNNKKRKCAEKKFFFLLIISMVASLLFGRGEIQAILINIRNMTVFFMGFEIGKYYLDSREKFEDFIKKYNIMMLIMLLAGIVLMIGGYKLYSAIGVNEVYIAKNDVGAAGVLNYRFFTTLSNFRIMRMGSLYYEPVNLAYLYSIGFLVNLLYRPKTKKANGRVPYLIVSGLGLILTFGKGGWLITACAILFAGLYKVYTFLLTKIGRDTIYRVSIILTVSLATLFCVYAYNNISTSANPHFWGVIRTWENVKTKPLGHGLGTGGNMAFTLDKQKTASFDADNPWLSTGGESAIFSFMYQIGIIGTMSLIFCAICMASGYRKSGDIFCNTMKILPVIIIGVGVLQENTFTPQCIMPFMMIQGACANIFRVDRGESGK